MENSRLNRNGPAEHGTVRDEGVELAVFSARIDARRQIGYEARIELTAGEGWIQNSAVDASHAGAQATRQHLAGKGICRRTPQRKDRIEARFRQHALTIR